MNHLGERLGYAALLVLFAVIAAPAFAQFETRSSSPVLRNPLSIAVADFNHDGKLDVAVADFTGQLAVLFGNGNGTFRPPTYYAVSYMGSIAAADFNHDGNMDLVMAEGLSDEVTVLLGNGDGTFQSPQSFATTAYPTFVAVGDFNNDGNPDLVVIDDPYVSVLLGNGDGTFQAPVDTTPSNVPIGIGTGDFNHDGKLDVAYVGGDQLTILLGNGDGTFITGASYPAGIDPGYVAVADFNRDGRLDLAIADFIGSQISIFLGNGDGTFYDGASYPAAFPGHIQAADLNGDGNADLVLLTAGPISPANLVTVMLGNGDGTFQPAMNFPSGKEAAFVVVGDFNGDRKLDLVAADYLGNAVDVLLNTGVVSFSPTTPLSFPAQFVGTTSSPKNVTLTNTGTTALSITSMSVNKPFLLGTKTTCGTSVGPGAKCTLSVVFQPTVMGVKTGLLVLNDSASTKPQVIELSGTGTALTVSPSQLNFGSQKVGTWSNPQNVTVTNTGSTAVNVTGVKIAGGDAGDFRSQTDTCGTQIAPGASCTISFIFAPITTGTRTAAGEINGPGGVVWQAVSLTGTGT